MTANDIFTIATMAWLLWLGTFGESALRRYHGRRKP